MTEPTWEALTDDDFLLMQERLLAETGRRISDPKEAAKLTGAQLTSLAMSFARLSEKRAGQASGNGFQRGEDLDLVALIERLPPEQARKQLQKERTHLRQELVAVEEAMKRSDKWKERLVNKKKYAKQKAAGGRKPFASVQAKAEAEGNSIRDADRAFVA